ncbi:kinase-like protein [Thelephora ganbajun]|uniref:Kinase-like protein n=1 Tax=Thelephora ganbajun TaxID=370292 RepID=A0ACB6Z650_THEGA|nr:kinase-like protein [Thelephora ganbajun]
MDSHYSLQVPNSGGSSRGIPHPASIQSTSSTSQPQSNLPTYRDIYSHPAAVAYAAAHPRRTIPKLGPYLLLQILGEGEFGRVKLGLHMQWGEEVAIKLIRKGNIDTSARISKVEREIEILKVLKHPNIVRLYDAIETDRYTAIILEYASGGDLFDHILAHRYLKEEDACKLFSQLISGVWYIHQKKIVHRNLKLENLLLDRHRNLIITGFALANRFEHEADKLMQASCRFPCYAAPELVISDSMYVGSAVDIWSCGVILYAMLAGYLPFDDDPTNPDRDINLLYRYIVSAPLSFPNYISAEARDLLYIMLVPDPKRRADTQIVMNHRWLRPGAGLFNRTLGDLEHAAMEQHQQKWLAHQRQMKVAATAAEKC